MTKDAKPAHHGHSNLETSLSVLTGLGLLLGLVDRYAISIAPLGDVGLMVAYAAGAVPATWSALQSLLRKRILAIDLLMVVAALAAAAVGAPLEGAILLTLFSFSGMLEHRAMGRARDAVEALMALRPEVALRDGPEGVQEVPVASLKPGDRVILRPGSRVPVDGAIIEGSGSFDESTITGESLPVTKGPGDKVHEATVNLNAVLKVEVRRALAESTVALMVKMVTEAQAMKAPSERFSEWFGQRYTWVVLIGSAVAYGAMLAYGLGQEEALYRAATLLVAASPCAVVISVPAAILSALSASARGGVLFKGGAALERLADVKIFAFDKTGTLTTGRAGVTGLVALEGEETAVLSLFAAIEGQSEHPIAAAIRTEAARRGLSPVAVDDAVSTPSEGISARDSTGPIWAGNPRMAARMGADLGHPSLEAFRSAAHTVVYLGRGPEVLGAISVADTARETSAAGLRALEQAGVGRLVMMTGDRAPVAARIAAELGITEVHADMLPGDKVALVDLLEKEAPTAFVGDGVNDAAALARSSVGIAMGVAGSEVALQAADVALLSDDMGRLAEAHRLARRTQKIIRHNLTFALGAMAVLVVGGLFFELPLPLAVIGHEGGTLLVVLNGLRLLWDPIRGPSVRA